ncbi:MAG: hypothetical protein WB762_29805 [Candidatus Sulfotelmatobacter sp.]
MIENLVSKAFDEFIITVSVLSTSKSCPDCGTELGYLGLTFFFEEQTQQIPIPICLKCHPTERVEPRYDT